MAIWPKSIAAGGMELELHHYTYESHHASGPQVTIMLRVLLCSITCPSTDARTCRRMAPARTLGARWTPPSSTRKRPLFTTTTVSWSGLRRTWQCRRLATSTTARGAAMANTTGVLCPTGMARTRTSIQTYPLSCANGRPSRALTRCTASAPARATTTRSSTSCSARLCLASACTAVPRTMPIAQT